MTTRLSISNLAGMVRTLVAVGTSSDDSMLRDDSRRRATQALHSLVDVGVQQGRVLWTLQVRGAGRHSGGDGLRGKALVLHVSQRHRVRAGLCVVRGLVSGRGGVGRRLVGGRLSGGRLSGGRLSAADDSAADDSAADDSAGGGGGGGTGAWDGWVALALAAGAAGSEGAAGSAGAGADGGAVLRSAASSRRDPPKTKDATDGAPSTRATDWRSVDRELLGDTGPLTF